MNGSVFKSCALLFLAIVMLYAYMSAIGLDPSFQPRDLIYAPIALARAIFSVIRCIFYAPLSVCVQWYF